MEESTSLIHTLIGPGLVLCYICLGIALVASVGMPILHLIKHPKAFVKMLLVLIGVGVLFGISYAISGSEVTAKAASLGIDASSSKMIGAGLILFYIALLTASALAIVSLVKDIISG